MIRNSSEVEYWLGRYNKEEIRYNTGLEEKLHLKFTKLSQVSKGDLIEIANWKFQGQLKGRGNKILRMIENVDNEIIEKITFLAFSLEQDKYRINVLCSIGGVGTAMASVILTFWDPQNYGIFDIHVWRELYGNEPKISFRTDNYLKVLNDIRKIAKESKHTCREVEKALFKKNLEEGRM